MRSEEIPRIVDDLMTVDLIAIQPTDRVGRARDLLLTLDLHALPVMDGNDVVGIVTSSDLVDDWPEDESVATVMTPTPITVGNQATLSEAAELMLANRVHHLLVDGEDEIVGILSSFDLLRAFNVSVT